MFTSLDMSSIIKAFVQRITMSTKFNSIRPTQFGSEDILREHDGRLYNGVQGDYALPADQEEIQRLNSQHKALTMASTITKRPIIIKYRITGTRIQSSLLAQSSPRVLDVGCGTGIWSIQVGEKLPQVSVTGVDLVSIHPPTYPSNVNFEKLDILQEFPDGWEGSFDLVHARYLIAGIRDFSLLLSRLTKLLKPNGHLVVVEPQARFRTVDNDIKEVCPMTSRISAVVCDAMLKLGIDPIPGKKVSTYLQENLNLEYDEVETKTLDMPLSPWSDDPRLHQIGQAHLPNSLSLPGAFRRLTVGSGIITEKWYDELTKGCQEEMIKAEGKLVLPVWLIWAKKK
ncbi:hypothetical protein L486_03033 [Kwoniella mangroviensis CBS 10435]|uniref:Methyltransferase domain-containing protein n=1 Tax=Kwoniella mangroviensis CBS 10435 TaxID=1331196 RepID=A0A1B9IXT6_9TREE|nr:hypothetical protein L486_03033 [Kwoniella mangroviensis CBS 10435]